MENKADNNVCFIKLPGKGLSLIRKKNSRLNVGHRNLIEVFVVNSWTDHPQKEGPLANH